MKTAYDALIALKEGNRRFAEGTPLHRYSPDERATVDVTVQRPWAVIVGCSDSRVPVEAVFDVGVGDLFVVRTAGHVLADAGLASVQFAAEKLGARLVVILGHEDCGAVTAALSGDAPAWLAPIVDHIDVSETRTNSKPGATERELLAVAVDDHVRATVTGVRELVDTFTPGASDTVVVGAAYRLASGQVHWLD